MRLADDLAGALEREPLGLPCAELAARLHRRRSTLVAALRVDPRFEHEGRTRGSRWRLVAEMPSGPNGNRSRRNDLPWDELDPSGVPVLASGPENAP
jgi:hypothetical protein